MGQRGKFVGYGMDVSFVFYYYRNKEEPERAPVLHLELSPQYPAKGQLGGPDLYLTHETGSSSVPPGKLILGFMVGMGCTTMGGQNLLAKFSLGLF